MRAPTSSSLKARFAARRAQRGFTLTELTVALVAGLLIAMAVVGLSREANNTFHEEMRTAAAESGIRTALDRLRSDLQRASFMSTGNIARDTQIAALPGQPHVSAANAGAYKALASLAGIRLRVGGSASTTPLSTVQPTPLNPDSIDIAGNITSSDQFVVLNIDPVSPACAGGHRIWLQVDTPAMWRILATQAGDGGTAGSADQALLNAFQPVPGKRSLIRLQDQKGMYQYLVTCDNQAAGGASAGVPQPYIDVVTNIVTSKDTGGFGGADGLCNGCMVNPVQVVRWEVKPSGIVPLNPNGDGAKYDLVRSFVDIESGNPITPGEVIAEYAVDLKFALTVDSAPTTNGQQPALTTLAFDDDTVNQQWSDDVAQLPTFGNAWVAGTPAPQRIRAVRVRLATRSSIADRSTNVPVPTQNPAPPVTQRFMFRYCVGPTVAGSDGGGSIDCTQPGQIWARARTVTTEAWLTNQGGFFYL